MYLFQRLLCIGTNTSVYTIEVFFSDEHVLETCEQAYHIEYEIPSQTQMKRKYFHVILDMP